MTPIASPRVPTPVASHSDVDRRSRGGAHVVVRGLTKEFHLGGRVIPVLRGLNFELRPGETASVVGASGVGKSTLLQVLGTLDAPTSGVISFDGVEVTAMSPARLAEFRNREIGFVFQFHHLLPEFTALENAMMPGMILRLSRQECVERSRAMLTRLGLGDRLGHRPGELSGGEPQRVALARALLLSPRLLLADEPTGNLDTNTGREMHRLFFELNRELGMTILIVTHNNELAGQTPRRLRMADGVIVDEA
ncbi:MAG TPA: ABC transporter ATP-binding protein [Polyangia bacterium]|nr:ABC transporter ATP-binding protein [Polyangia bacterium]